MTTNPPMFPVIMHKQVVLIPSELMSGAPPSIEKTIAAVKDRSWEFWYLSLKSLYLTGMTVDEIATACDMPVEEVQAIVLAPNEVCDCYECAEERARKH